MRRFVVLKVTLALIACSCSPAPDDGRVDAAAVRQIQLLNPSAPLPPSASNVWFVEKHFLDTYQMVRFDASLADARAFARNLLDGRSPVRGHDPRLQYFGTDLEWWLRDFPANAEGGAKHDGHLRAQVVIVPDNERATVWALMFSD
jgi:hypothetical protein